MHSDPTPLLLPRARSGDRTALSELLAWHTPALERLVVLRMHSQHRRHFEPADVVQEALAEATQRFHEWCGLTTYPFHVWLRLLTGQALARAERDLHREKRDVARESPIELASPKISAANAAEWIVSTHTSPTQAARRNELRELVNAALEGLDPLDREILALRHFEQLSNEDAAAELGIEPAAASKRFMRALQRIRPALRALEQSSGTNRP